MAKYRMVRIEFWKNPIVVEEMAAEEKYFYLYLLTNLYTTQIGIYRITKKQIAFDMGYSIELIDKLMERFIEDFKLIRYNPKTRELAIKNWGKENLFKGGKPVMDCVFSQLKEVVDTSLIPYISENIPKEEIRRLYESFCKDDIGREVSEQVEDATYPETKWNKGNDTFTCRSTIRGQKEKEKEKEKQQDLYSSIENHIERGDQSQKDKTKAVNEIIKFWDTNGFGISNVNAKEQLLSWLNDSSFLQSKEVILKALAIACANNKRQLNYVVGILKNWENESLLTVEEIDSYTKKQKHVRKHNQSTELVPAGRPIPSEFILDITAGEA